MFMLSVRYYIIFVGFKSQTHTAVKFFLLIFASSLTVSIYFSRNIQLISLRNLFFYCKFFYFLLSCKHKGHKSP